MDNLLFRRNFNPKKRVRDGGGQDSGETKRIKEDVARGDAEENCNKFNKNKSYYQSKSAQNQSRRDGRFKNEAASTSAGAEENCYRSNRNNSPCNRRNVQNQGRKEERNSPNVEIGARRINPEAASTVIDVEDSCKRFNRNNSPYGENPNRFYRKNSPFHFKSHGRNSPNMIRDNQQTKEDDARERYSNQMDFKSGHEERREDLRERKWQPDSYEDKHKKDDPKQSHRSSESSKSNFDEKQRKHVSKTERRSRSRENKSSRRNRSRSRDRNRIKNEERRERKSSLQDDAYKKSSGDEKIKNKEVETVTSDLKMSEEYSQKIEIKHEESRIPNKVLETDESECKLSSTTEDLIQDKKTSTGKVTFFKKLENPVNNETKTVSTSDKTSKSETNNSIEGLNVDILRSDLNISNDSAPGNSSDLGVNSGANDKSQESAVDKNLTGPLSSSNVSDDSMKKVTPTIRRRRCVMSFKN